jgi:hypothetical protein
MPDPANSYNLRSYGLYKLQPETPILAKDAKLIVDDVVGAIIGYQQLVSGIIVPIKRGQIITHNGTSVTLKDIGADGRIAYTDSGDPDSWIWADPSVLGFMSALLVRDNGTDIGSQTALNFIDGGGIVWAITDDAGNDEIEVSASVTFPSQTLFNKSTTNQTTNSTSLVDLTNLSLAIAANATVYFRAVIHVGTNAANGLRYAVTIPASATMKVMVLGQTTTAIAAGTSGNATQWITTSGTETGTINAISQANQNVVLEGWVAASSTAGTIQIQGRSTNALTTATFNSGSFITGHVV